MHLVTTALRDFWPDEGPIWLLSHGCCPNLNKIEMGERWEIQGVVTDPFQDKNEMALAYSEVWCITNDLIELLAGRLNTIHKKDHSVRYWRTHIGFWALMFVTVIYDRHARLLMARSEIDTINVVGRSDINYVIPLDTIDFVHEATDDLYNSQIITILCNKMRIPVVDYKLVEKKYQPEKVQTFGHSLLKKLLRSVMSISHSMLSSTFGRRADVLMVASYLPWWFEIALSFSTYGRILPLHHKRESVEIPSYTPVDEVSRSMLSIVPKEYKNIRAIIVEMVGMCIPKVFVEGFEALCFQSEGVFKEYQPKAIYSANSWYYDEAFKHWAAVCREQGTKLIGGEHGGASFVDKHKISQFLEISISDYYLTWGWLDSRQPNIIHAPANKLISMPKRICKAIKERVLYICTAEARHNVGRLENFLDYLDWQKRFFISIPPWLIGKFLVRLHYNDFGWNIKNRMLNVTPDLKFDSWEYSIRSRLRDSRLNVFDYIGTTFAEALSMNVPTIIFSDEDRYPFNGMRNPYFCETKSSHLQALKDVHILHDSPECAASWVEQVYDNPDSWWKSKVCQKVVKDFCYSYARTSKKPLREWKSTFETLLKLSEIKQKHD